MVGATGSKNSRPFASDTCSTEPALPLTSERLSFAAQQWNPGICAEPHPRPSEESLNYFHHIELRINDRQLTPLSKRETRMADIESDHVSHPYVISRGDLHKCMLIHQLGGFP